MTVVYRRAFSWKRCPRSIQFFIVSYLACVALAAVNSYLQLDFFRRLLEDAGLSELTGHGWVYALILLRSGIVLAILAWVLLRHSLIGRLFIAAQFVGWAFGTPHAIALISKGRITALPYLLAGLCSAIAVVGLLAKSSRLWFSRKGRTLADDLDSFS